MKEILDYCNDLQIVTFCEGEVLLEENIKSNLVYILIEGHLDIIKNTICVATVEEPGSIVGEMSAILDIPHTAKVCAKTFVKAYKIENGSDYFKSHQQLSWYVAKLLAQRLNAATTYLVDLTKQFAGAGNHLEMVGEVIESLMHHQEKEYHPGSQREPENY